MKILLLNQFFHPDTAATSQLLTDLARELASRSHEVVVICGKSDYSDAGEQTAALPNISIIRSKQLPFSRSHLGRLGSYASYLLASIIQSLRGPAPDLILTLTTPPLLSLVGTLVKSVRGSRHFIWEMDLYPDVAVDLGMLQTKSPITKIVGALADLSRRKADGIIVLGEDMRDRILRRGIPGEKVSVVHNWADRSEIAPQPLPPSPLTVYYSGNLGLAHDTGTIQKVMLSLAKEEKIRFVFAGGGAQKQSLQRFCEDHKIPNVSFHSYCNRDQLSNNLAKGHLGLVMQKPETTGSIVPSKVYGIMAAGRPILYIGSRSATPARIIERFECGWQVETGNDVELTAALIRLASRPNEIRDAGERGHRAFLDHFERSIGVTQIIGIIDGEEKRLRATA